MRRILLGVFAVVMGGLLAQSALAAASGTALGVNASANAVLDSTTRVLTVGTDIFLGDKITTGTVGQVQILFNDNTQLVIGPNSTLAIEDYLIRNDGSAGKLVVDMLSGSFRFATGDAPKNDYLIKTPTGTIGVRGTAFDVFIDDKGVAHVVMFEGTTIICADGSDECKVLTGLCEFGEIADDSALLGNTQDSTGGDRAALKAQFRYLMDQSPLLREFWQKHSYQCLHATPVNNTPQSLLQGGGGSCGSWGDAMIGEDYNFPVNNCGGCPSGYEAGEGEGSGQCFMNDY